MGRSHECDFPARVRRLPVCSAPRFDVGGGSRAIDRLVRETLREALSIYHVDGDRVRELRPDVILTQSLCDVCAVSLADVERAVASWIGARPRIVSLSPATLADVGADVVRVGGAGGVAGRGRPAAPTSYGWARPARSQRGGGSSRAASRPGWRRSRSSPRVAWRAPAAA